jgi:uncharacterized protein
MANHPYPEIITRLKRANGHLRMIVKMIEDGRPCVELAQQLQAVENAIDNAKKTLIHDHIHDCLDRASKTPGPKGKAVLKQFKAITKYL